jgi:hypothetical protein
MISSLTGLAHGTSSAAAVAAVDRLQQELLCYGLEASVAFRAVEADPDFAAGHALAAAVHLFAMSPDGAARAGPHLALAQALEGGATARERLLIRAIVLWAESDTAGAVRLHHQIAERWPRDLISARIAQFHQMNSGDFSGMRQLMGRLLAANPDVTHVEGMLAFALEQTGAAAEAERLARHAADAGFDPWAEHVVAHALERQGRAAEALLWLEPRSAGWSRCSSFLNTHNWWHVALFELDLGRRDAALDLYDNRVWGVRKAYCQDQVNAVSLLARLELHGVDVADRWVELADWLAPRTREHVNGFLDLHYLYGLARAGATGEVSAMLDSLAERAAAAGGAGPAAITSLAARGLAAHAHGRADEAAVLLGQALPRLRLLGGSSTQRDLFSLLHLAALAAAVPAEARRHIARRWQGPARTAWPGLFQQRLQTALPRP